MNSTTPGSEIERAAGRSVCPFDETVECELKYALDNYEGDPDENGALDRLVNNCVTIGYEFATRTPEAARLVEALKATRLELFWCQKQLAAHGQTGCPNDSVARALDAAATALAQVRHPSGERR